MNPFKRKKPLHQLFFITNAIVVIFWAVFVFNHRYVWSFNAFFIVTVLWVLCEVFSFYLFYRMFLKYKMYLNHNEQHHQKLNQFLKGNYQCESGYDVADSNSNASKRIEKMQKGFGYYNQTILKFNQDLLYLIDQIKEKNVQLLTYKTQTETLIDHIKAVSQESQMLIQHAYDPVVITDENDNMVWKNNSFTSNYIEMNEQNALDFSLVLKRFEYKAQTLNILDDKTIRLEKVERLKQLKDLHFEHITKRNFDLNNNIHLLKLVKNILESLHELLGTFHLKLYTLTEKLEWEVMPFEVAGMNTLHTDYDFTRFMTDEWVKHPRLDIIRLEEDSNRVFVIAPLEIDGKIQAAYGLMMENAISETDKQTIRLFYNQFTMVVQREVIYQTLRNQYFNTIEALVNVIEAKDKYTEGHSRRVSRFAVEIAKKMGYSNEEVEKVEISGLLHDVGKIGIQQSILVKQGRLTDEEYEEMKLHPEKAIQILDAIDLESDIMEGILYHHLRYDLKGYPRVNLEKLPNFASIIGIADAFDAITSARSYSGKRSIEEAVMELTKYKGTQFEPTIVDVMIELIKEHRQRIEGIINDDHFSKRKLKGDYHVLSSAL